jgi:hypothetical protein
MSPDRVPLDPPPVVQLIVSSTADAWENYLISAKSYCALDNYQANSSPVLDPNLFVHTTLVGVNGTPTPISVADSLTGTLVSSIYRLNDENGQEGGFFIFGDLSVKVEGLFVLRFSLFDKRDLETFYVTSIDSAPFHVIQAKDFIGTVESTPLTKAFCNQGARLRLRKAPQSLLRKRGPASEDYHKRQYKGRRQSKTQPKPPGQSLQRKESKAEESISEQLQPRELRLAASYEPASPSAPHQGVLSLHPGTISAPQLQTMLDEEQQLSARSPQLIQSPVQLQQGSLRSDDQSTQHTSYGPSVYRVPSVPPSAQGLLDSSLGQQTESIKPYNTGSLLSQRTSQQLSQHDMTEISAASLQTGTSGFPLINDAQDMQQGNLQFSIGSTLTSGPPLQVGSINLMPGQDQTTGLGQIQLNPNAGQNLSAGSMGLALPGPPSNSAVNTTSGNATAIYEATLPQSP